ncbi:MAG: hypothetical protein R6U85_10235 [Salinivirgaceae bacterium]
MKKLSFSIVLLVAAFLGLTINSFAQGQSAASRPISSGNLSLDCKVNVNLTSGYTFSTTFMLNGNKFLFSHNSNSGATSIWNLDKGGSPVYTKTWSKGWTNINVYEFRGKTYFFHQKERDGLARISELNYNDIMNGKRLGPRVYEKNWSSGWTNTLFFVHNDIVYFLHYKAGSGLARLNASTSGRDVGKKIYEKKWTTGYSNFAMTTHKGNFFILYQKGAEGTCVINKINLPKLEAAARVGLNSPNLGTEVYRKKWSSGWGNAEFFHLNGDTYLFINKPSQGKVHIENLQASGKLGPRVYEKTWSKGWTSIDIFYERGKPQLMHQKQSTGQTKICELKF